jgi:hypothetical protein
LAGGRNSSATSWEHVWNILKIIILGWAETPHFKRMRIPRAFPTQTAKCRGHIHSSKILICILCKATLLGIQSLILWMACWLGSLSVESHASNRSTHSEGSGPDARTRLSLCPMLPCQPNAWGGVLWSSSGTWIAIRAGTKPPTQPHPNLLSWMPRK